MTRHNKTVTLLMLCLIAGTLDAIAAILMGWKYPAASIFKYIAGGWFGAAAFKGGTGMIVWGVAFHYLIAAIYSCAFFFTYPGFKRVIGNKIAITIIIGVVIWGVMKFVVLPLTTFQKVQRRSLFQACSLAQVYCALRLAHRWLLLPTGIIQRQYIEPIKTWGIIRKLASS